MKHPGRNRAYSIIELMVAVFIISTCLLLIIGMFVFIFNSTQKGIDLTAGVVAGEQFLSKYIYDNYNTLAPTSQSSTFLLNKVNYYYDLSVEALDPATELFRVQLTIYWWDPKSRMSQTSSEGFAQGYGAFKTDLVRYYYKAASP